MKVLIVCSGTEGILSPFIKDQMDSLAKLGIEFSLFQINKRGFLGYLLHLKSLRRTIKQIKPDLIHAHYGLSGLLANMQRSIPVVTTFHGSDVNNKRVRPFSWLASRLSAANIFVSKEMLLLMPSPKSFIIPCGVDIQLFRPKGQIEARNVLGLKPDKKYILFSSSFDNSVKNYPLAQSAISLLTNDNVKLLELKGFSRIQVSLLMNAADMVLMTSFTEGSPQFIKEAMTCNCPIVATNVGDIREVIGETEGCYIASFDPLDVADKLNQALDYGKRTNGRENIRHLDNQIISQKIIDLYKNVTHNA